MTKTLFKKEKGFTLVEVLIAVTIFSIAVTGIITATVQSGMSINDAKYRTEANYLAGEGIELVRAMRDSYVLANLVPSDGWTHFIDDFYTVCSGPCDVDAFNDLNSSSALIHANNGTSIIPCVQSTGYNTCQLNYDTTTGFYKHNFNSVSLSPFTRTITIPPLPVGATTTNELQLTVTVSWKEGVSTQSVTMNESLFNWYSYH